MSDSAYIFLLVYLFGFAVSGVIFYFGGVRGRSRKPELWAVLFALVWFITLPLIVREALKGEKK